MHFNFWIRAKKIAQNGPERAIFQILLIALPEEHLELSLLQNDPEHCILMFGSMLKINSQSLEDTQVGYISQKYSFDKYTLGQAFKPSYALLSI